MCSQSREKSKMVAGGRVRGRGVKRKTGVFLQLALVTLIFRTQRYARNANPEGVLDHPASVFMADGHYVTAEPAAGVFSLVLASVAGAGFLLWCSLSERWAPLCKRCATRSVGDLGSFKASVRLRFPR